MKSARCPCGGTGIVVGYNRGAEPSETYLCLKCSGRFTAPLARAEGVKV